MSMPKQSVIFCAIFVNLIIAMACSKHPINADFVNGLWARIGKRAFEMNCNEPHGMDLKTYINNCVETEKDSLKPFAWKIKDLNSESSEKSSQKLKNLIIEMAGHRPNENNVPVFIPDGLKSDQLN